MSIKGKFVQNKSNMQDGLIEVGEIDWRREDLEAIRVAGVLCDQLHLSFWDALVIVSAARSGADTLFSEDLSHNQVIHGVRVVNPFSGLRS